MENIIESLDKNQKVDKNQARTLITVLFISVPILSSLISTYHLISFFTLGHSFILALMLGIAFEVGSVSSFLAITVLKKINRNLVWTVFIAITLVQILGNIYYVFNYIHHKVIENSDWMLTITQIFAWFGFGTTDAAMIVAIMSGGVLPLISLFLLKSTADYLDQGNFNDERNESEKEIQIVEVEKIVESKPRKLTLEEEIKQENNYFIDNKK